MHNALNALGGGCPRSKFSCCCPWAYASKRTLGRTYRFASHATNVILGSSLS